MTTRKRYSKEFKLDAVSLVTEQGYSRAEAARSLGINANMLCRCVNEERAGAPYRNLCSRNEVKYSFITQH